MSPRRADPPTLEFVILGLIRLQPTHGYDLFRTLQQDEGIGLIWQVKPGRLYALLEKLEGQGWLEPDVKPGERFSNRKEYRLTPAGEDAFLEWLHSPVTAAHRMRQEFLARLFFAPYEGIKVLETITSNQKKMCRRWLKSLQQAYQKLDGSQNYERSVLSFRIGQVEAMLHWLEQNNDQR
jgi:DNA-binding PadR family transcriptional regulator